jgi:hypothetical protein
MANAHERRNTLRSAYSPQAATTLQYMLAVWRVTGLNSDLAQGSVDLIVSITDAIWRWLNPNRISETQYMKVRRQWSSAVHPAAALGSWTASLESLPSPAAGGVGRKTGINLKSLSVASSESLSFAYKNEINFPTTLLIVILKLSAVARRKCASNLVMLKNCWTAAADMTSAEATLSLNLPHIR